MIPDDDTTASILELASQLVRIPSRAGIDPYGPIIDAVQGWLRMRGIDCTVLRSSEGSPVGVCALVSSGRKGPVLMLDATLDTAEFGDESKWRDPPTSAQIREGWLYGRGTADSKGGAALFCHLLAEYAASAKRASGFHGTLILLLDLDEHTGGFAGVKRYFASDYELPRPEGVFIGYPGNDRIVTGGRGFVRARVVVHGKSAHSGSSGNRGVNAVLRAAKLAEALARLRLPPATKVFPLPPQLTVTRIEGGEGFSLVPDRCELELDIRLTPGFKEASARAVVARRVRAFDADRRDVPRTNIDWQPGWPAYTLKTGMPILKALSQAAREVFGAVPRCGIAGPSNIGNYLACLGIPTISGFGMTYRGVHANDECIEIASIAPVYQVYRGALERLLVR